MELAIEVNRICTNRSASSANQPDRKRTASVAKTGFSIDYLALK
jgi:hypothetical protein